MKTYIVSIFLWIVVIFSVWLYKAKNYMPIDSHIMTISQSHNISQLHNISQFHSIYQLHDISELHIITSNSSLSSAKAPSYKGDGRYIANSSCVYEYDMPDTMKLGDNYRCVFKLKKKVKEDIFNQDQESSLCSNYSLSINHSPDSEESIDSILISSSSSIRLMGIGSKAFEISPLFNSEFQAISETDISKWEWNVVPLIKDQPNSIIGILSTKSFDGVNNNIKEFVIFEKDIIIETNIFSKILSFIIENWQYILTTVLIPLLSIIHTKKMKKRTANNV